MSGSGRTALVVIGMQKGFDDASHLTSATQALPHRTSATQAPQNGQLMERRLSLI